MKKNLEKAEEQKVTEEEKKTPSAQVTKEKLMTDKNTCVEESGESGEADVCLENAAPCAQERIAELETLAADLQNQYLRKVADFDNYRKRMIREKQEAIDFANTNILVDLVEVLDNFDRAIVAGGEHEPGTPAAA